MLGIGVLLLLLFISSIPAIIVFFWFRLGRYPFTFSRFAVSLLAGATSFFLALFLQKLVAGERIFTVIMGKWGLLAEIFVRTALTEELSRLVMLLVLFLLTRRFVTGSSGDGGEAASINAGTQGSAFALASASGLIAGFGFAILESAVYGASNPGNAILRVFTATPLHGACGSNVGISLLMFPQNPVRAVFRFFIAVVIHGVYNFMMIIPGRMPPIAAVLIALSALASSIVAIRGAMMENIR